MPKENLSMTRRNVSPISGNAVADPSQRSSSMNENEQLTGIVNIAMNIRSLVEPVRKISQLQRMASAIHSSRKNQKCKTRKPKQKLRSKSGIIDKNYLARPKKREYAPKPGIQSYHEEIKVSYLTFLTMFGCRGLGLITQSPIIT